MKRVNIVVSGDAKEMLLKSIEELMGGDKTAVTGVCTRMQTFAPTSRNKNVRVKLELAFDSSLFATNGVIELGDCKIVPLFVFDSKHITPPVDGEDE